MKRRTLLAAALAGAGWAHGGRASLAPQSEKLDLLVRGGTVIDPANGIQARADLGIRAGRIAMLEPGIDPARASRVLDASGQLVTPGLIDLHAHIFPQRAGGVLLAEELAPRTAVTTWVSAGDASLEEIAEFRRFAARHTRCRVYGFVHLAAATPRPSVTAQANASTTIEALARRLTQHRDAVIGIALHPAGMASSGDEAALLSRALELAERAETRVRILCNIAGVQQVAPLLERLRPGDILAHAYSGVRSDLMGGGRLHSAALAARRRGVLIDPAPGARHFDLAVARAAIEQGLLPDVLSSAAPAARAEPSLTTVMSQFLALGFELEHVLAMTTVNPARVIGREPRLGTLELGAPADVSILALDEAAVEFTDARGERWRGTRILRPVRALRAGIPLA